MADSKKDKYVNGIAKFLIAVGCMAMVPVACTDESITSGAGHDVFLTGCAATIAGGAILAINNKEK